MFFYLSCVLGSGFELFLLVLSLPPPTLSAGAGLDNQATLLWHRTRFPSFWAGFGVAPAYFVLPTPPPLSAGLWSVKPDHFNVAHDCRFFVFFLFVLPRGRGRCVFFCYPDRGTGLCDFLLSLFRWYTFASTPSLRLWRYFGFSLFRRQILAPRPLSGDGTSVFLDVFPVPYVYASFLSFIIWHSLSAS